MQAPLKTYSRVIKDCSHDNVEKKANRDQYQVICNTDSVSTGNQILQVSTHGPQQHGEVQDSQELLEKV